MFPRKSTITHSVMSLFFGLLPTDLQIDFVLGWLNDADCGCSLLKILSALDVACSVSEQRSLRSLMGQLPAFGDNTEHGTSSTRATRHAASCVPWLADRNVPVQTLLLSGNVEQRLQAAELILPLIETLNWRDPGGYAQDLLAVVRRLPNLTAVHVENRVVLHAALTPKLKIFTITGRPVNNCLPLHGTFLQLQELRLEHFELAEDFLLDQCCPNLKLLQVSVPSISFSKFLTILRGCLSLEELVLHRLQMNQGAEIAALPNIKRLTVTGLPFHNVEVFVDVLGRYPGLEYLSIDGLAYYRKESRLELPGHSIPVSSVPRILSACSSLEVISSDLVMDCAMAEFVADQFSSTLKSLTVRTELPALATVLQRCGASLRNLCLNSEVRDNCSLVLGLVAITCPQLVTLSLHFGVFPEEYSFSALFQACVELKELTLKVDRTIGNRRVPLGAIVSNELRLKLLKLVGTFDQADVVWFRQQIQDMQQLPVPVILLLTTC